MYDSAWQELLIKFISNVYLIICVRLEWLFSMDVVSLMDNFILSTIQYLLANLP